MVFWRSEHYPWACGYHVLWTLFVQNENIPYKCTVSDHIPVLFKPTYFLQLFTVSMPNFLQKSFNSIMIYCKYHVEGPPQGHLECHIGYTYSQPIFIIYILVLKNYCILSYFIQKWNAYVAGNLLKIKRKKEICLEKAISIILIMIMIYNGKK